MSLANIPESVLRVLLGQEACKTGPLAGYGKSAGHVTSPK